MSATGFSHHFARELDVEQLLELMKLGGGIDGSATGDFVPPAWLAHIRTDVECPSCFVRGAVLVRGTHSMRTGKALRQAHFRFIGSDGQDAHHPLCDFYHSGAPTSRSEHAVDFGSDKSALTRAVRKLVCSGIELGVFDQPAMRDLRKWFFEKRLQNRFDLALPPEAVDWYSKLMAYASTGLPFRPVHGELAGFDWKQAARQRLRERHAQLVGSPLRVYGWPKEAGRAKALIIKHVNQRVFDPASLQSYYAQTISLARFAASHYPSLAISQRQLYDIGVDDRMRAIMALCALLLNVSGWSTDLAVEKLITLIKAPEPRSGTLGNMIGLNPFHDYVAWSLIRHLSDVFAGADINFDHDGEVAAIERGMRAEHEEWRKRTS